MQISYSASLSRQKDSSEFSTSWCTESVQLYGSTTVSETFGDGTIENVNITRSGYSSRILEIKSVPMPAPESVVAGQVDVRLGLNEKLQSFGLAHACGRNA